MSEYDPIDRTPFIKGGRRWRFLPLVLLAVMAMTVVAPAGAAADTSGHRPKVDYFESPLGRVYGNIDDVDGFVVISGGTVGDVCADNPPPTAPGLRRQHPDGTWRIKTLGGGFTTTVAVYETDLEVFAFIGASCGGLAEGVPLPEPFATGHVVLRDSIRGVADASAGFETQLPGGYRNGVRGTVRTPDGERYRLRTRVEFDIGENGEFTVVEDTFVFRPRHHH